MNPSTRQKIQLLEIARRHLDSGETCVRALGREWRSVEEIDEALREFREGLDDGN